VYGPKWLRYVHYFPVASIATMVSLLTFHCTSGIEFAERNVELGRGSCKTVFPESRQNSALRSEMCNGELIKNGLLKVHVSSSPIQKSSHPYKSK